MVKTLLCLSTLLWPGSAPVSALPAGQRELLCEDIKKPFFSVSCGKDGACQAAPNRGTSIAAGFTIPKPAGEKRVFVLGESAASILGGGAELAPGNGGLTVINCGMGAYEATRIKAVFSEVLNYQPDLIVVLSGNNEGRPYPCPGIGFAMRRLAARLAEVFYALKPGEKNAAITAGIKLQELSLDLMGKEAARKKVPLILCALPSNLAMPPSGPAPAGEKSFLSAAALFEKRDFESSARLFRARLAADRTDLFSRFYLARSLEASGRYEEARAEYLGTIELDPRQDRASVSRNAMIRRVAARRGAGLCDLEKVFQGASKNGIPGFAQFADAMHWRPSYNGLVWSEFARTGRALGLEWLKDKPGGREPPALTTEDLRKAFSYAVSYMNDPSSSLPPGAEAGYGVLQERALALLEFIETGSPGLAERTALSESSFRDFFISNFWSRRTGPALEGLRPLFIAHLAELEQRKGNYRKALVLADRAARLDPDKPLFRLLRAGALAGQGEKKKAEAELRILHHVPGLRERAEALAGAAGLRLPDPEESRAGLAASKKAADYGVERLAAGDISGAEAALAEAVKLNPANSEAFLTLCAARSRKADLPGAVEACGLAAAAAPAYPAEARRRLTSDALYGKGLLLLKLGGREAAAEEFRKSLKDPPPGWPDLEAAKAELKKLD